MAGKPSNLSDVKESSNSLSSCKSRYISQVWFSYKTTILARFVCPCLERTKEKDMHVFCLPLISMQHCLQVQGYFISLVFSHVWKWVWSKGISHFSQDNVAWRVLSSSHAAGASSGKQQRMGRICSPAGSWVPTGGSCVSICGCSLLVCHTRSHLGQFWWHSSGAARFGADFLLQHSWMFLPSKQSVGLLAALPASIACTPAMSPALLFSRLLVTAADTLTPSQKCQRWDLLVPGHSSGHCFHTCYPLRQLVLQQPRVFPSWTGVCVLC